ncbi:TonB-dependent receptor [Novosphingobium sp. BL-52-GroH]|uniref:TonB-dependent receptor n=1 Tax=Novosphingobium sp. BL-52-GroH TaxID=3349877 RepID=UPI00384B3890
MQIFRRALIIGTALTSPFAAVAQAQQQPAAPAQQAEEAQGLQDIVVTAQRREERLQDVPVAVTAFGTAELEKRQIGDVQALTQNAPAITFSATPYGNNDLILAIRGVAPGGVLPNVDQAVGTYVDGIYYARSEGSNFALVDIASAEVLRGPQGTLFGRNTIGGALNIATNKPSYEHSGSLKLAYGNYNAITAQGIANLPLVDDKLAARVVLAHVQHDGWGENARFGDVADQNDNFVRASLRADPAEGVRFDLIGDYYAGKNHQSLWVLRDYLPGTSPAAYAPYVAPKGSRVSQQGFNPLNQSEIYTLTGIATVDLGFAELKSITGYRNMDFQGANDQDGTPLPTVDVLEFEFVGDQFSQELQLTGESADSSLVWVTGAYYFREKVRNTGLVRAGATIQVNELIPENESLSAFAQLTYEVTPGLRLTGGLRYVVDHRDITYRRPLFPVAAAFANTVTADLPAGAIGAQTCPYATLGLTTDAVKCSFSPKRITFKTVPFTVGIDYKPDADSLLYAKFARGFRAGGHQQPTGTTVTFFTPFKEEKVDSWEVGAKLSLFDRRLQFAASGYYSLYSDVQQNSLLSSTPSIVIAVVNAGKERIYGAEFEATALLGDLRLSGSLGLIEPEFTAGPYKDTSVPAVSKVTWAVSGDYPIELSDGSEIELHADYNWRSKVNFLNIGSVGAAGLVPYSAFQAAAVTQEAYGLLAARISYKLRNSDLTFSLFGKNLTNEYFAGRTGSLAGANFNSIVLGEPRTYGVSLSASF